MKNIQFPMTAAFVLTSLLSLSLVAQAATEVYQGQSEIGNDNTGRACTLTIEKDDKSADILAFKIEAPAHMIQQEIGQDRSAVEDILPSKNDATLIHSQKHSDFHFQRLQDLQGEGFVLQGEKTQKFRKNEKLFMHFDVQDHKLVGVEYEKRESRASAKLKKLAVHKIPVHVSLEKICTNLKKL